jgi:hypothetical protein
MKIRKALQQCGVFRFGKASDRFKVVDLILERRLYV